MLGTTTRSIVTTTVIVEVGIAGWVLGYGALWLLVMIAAVTAADTVWGVLRRHVPADIAGLEVAALLGILMVAGADTTLIVLTAAACAAWLIRPERQEPPLERLTRPAGAPSAS
ncbi:MAG: hypothetical protein QOJ13_2225 [Gaiellales bacterium]|jgi:hypothetical protein|nr:hypothetical protein [Gaiellales bacterium]